MFPTKFQIYIIFIILLSYGETSKVGYEEETRLQNIGLIIDPNSRFGKETMVAMEIAIQEFNSDSSNYHKLGLNVRGSGGDPLQSASAANHLIEERKSRVIIGMDTWQEATLVTEIGNHAQVPVLSFLASSMNPPLTSVRWPYLVRMANNDSQQMRCVAAITSSYRWRKVIAIYEDDTYGGSSGILTLLSDALQDVGSEIEYWSALPPFSLSNSESTIRGELEKISKETHSRVFIVLRASLELAVNIFKYARVMDLMGKDSVWITADTTRFETSSSFEDFSNKFRKHFRSKYQDEDKFDPGFNALYAYDTISIVAKAMERLAGKTTSNTLLENILVSDFHGLSGKIQFVDGQISRSPEYRIVNVVQKRCLKLKFWSPEFGFYDGEKSRNGGDGGKMNVLGDVVNWPGGLIKRLPHGWVMPTKAKPMNIAVPNKTLFDKFVKVKDGYPTGFSMDVFKKAVKLLDYDLPHVFHLFNGTYGDLVDHVYLKKFDAVVGDVTILANRSKYVEFTQPYAESGLTMIVTVKSEESQRTWMFMRPFTKAMWLVTGAEFIYTMFVVWFLEHRSNLVFRGPWKSQVGTTLWFTFSIHFFAHREKLHSNFTRLVIVVWLFVVFVLTCSYTASLTSMLTVQRFEPTVTDVDYLKIHNSTVGCDGDSFIRNYLEKVLNFHPKNIRNIASRDFYADELRSGNISAAFMELPYERVFFSKYCNKFKTIGPTDRFGGLGFVFPKGSPIAADFSEAFLKLSEDGNITKMDKNWFRPSSECLESRINDKSLSFHYFWGLFLLTGGTSTIAFLLYLIRLFKTFKRQEKENSGNGLPLDGSVWDNTRRLAIYFNKGKLDHSERPETQEPDVEDWVSIRGEDVGRRNTPGNPQAFPQLEIEVPDIFIGHLGTQTRILSIASFPGWDRRGHGLNLVST
ncbi:hypothetical protein GIB67_025503 [Kingdonia uniflora]|uniref:Glutamate receptor n=1 Tax=Kingdonia uniflora TaxID=39325 RepID=A0A7J7PCN1_9MAGN|nr:hypothetical protein GIB67_025503 [Kingdonia uniflora]